MGFFYFFAELMDIEKELPELFAKEISELKEGLEEEKKKKKKKIAL